MCRTLMERNGIHLFIIGLCSLSPCLPQQKYVLIQSPKTWYDAQTYCREKCFDLATINNMGEMMMILPDVQGKYVSAAWTGLQKGTVRSWQWSLADNSFYKAGERNYLIWGSINDYNCSYFYGGQLFMASCTETRDSICFDGKQVGQQQYVHILTAMTWAAARDYCRTYHTDLVSVRNLEESLMIQQASNDVQVWTGLFRDPWEWSDYSTSSFRYWKPDQSVYTTSNITCVALIQSEYGKWGDLSCTEVHPFLCHCPTRVKFVKVRISSGDSKLDLNQPAVQDGILKQIKQKMSDNNVDNVFHLYWKKNPDRSVFTRDWETEGK